MVLASPTLQADRLYSKDPLSWRLVTTTAGYFVYDFYVHRLGHRAAMLLPYFVPIQRRHCCMHTLPRAQG